jgi:hypothetical protein
MTTAPVAPTVSLCHAFYNQRVGRDLQIGAPNG